MQGVLMASESGAFRRYAQWMIAHRILVGLAILGSTAFLVTRIGSLQVDSNPEILAPQTHPYVITTHLLERVFGGKNIVVIGIAPRQGDVYQPQVLAKIKRIQDGIEQLPEAVRHNILSVAARKVKVIKGGSEGMEVRPIMEAIPQTPEDIARLRAAVAAMPIYVNALVSPDGKAAAVIADFKQDDRFPTWIALLAGMRKIVDRERDDSVDIHLGGTPIIAEAADGEFAKMPLFFGASLLIIMAIQYWSFRSLQGMLLPVITGILSALWALGGMGLLHVHLDPLSITTPILILAVAAGHAIQVLKRYYEEYNRLRSGGMEARAANRTAVVESMVRVGPVMITAGSIATLTFFSLVTTGSPAVQHFGVFSGCGVLAAMTLEMTFIPVLRSTLPAPKTPETARERAAGILDRLLLGLANNLVGGRARWIVVGGVAVLAVVGSGLVFLHVDNNFKLYFKPTTTLRVDDQALNRALGGTNTLQFLIQTREPDGIKNPQVLQGMADLQTFLESQPDVGKTQSLADLTKRMNQAMHADNPADYSIPNSRNLIAQYLFLYSLSGDPQDFDSFVDNDYQRASVWAYLKNDSTSYADSVAHKAQAVIARSFPPGVSVQMGGTLAELMALNSVIVRDKFLNMAQMALIVFILGSIIFRSPVGGLFVVAPLVAVTVANFGLMGWLDIKLDISAMSSAAMAVGIGADYEIYLLFRFREELRASGNLLAATKDSLLTSGKAILFVALSVIGGYAVLQVSDFAFFNHLSDLVMATMAVSAFFAIFFLRALMMLFKPRFVFRDQREALFGRPALAADGSGS
jgi:uncharacterized protein